MHRAPGARTLILPRITRNSALPLATMAFNASLVGYLVGEEVLEEDPVQTLPQTLPTVPEILVAMGLHPRLELPLRTEVEDRRTSEGMGQGGSNRELAVLAGSLILELPVRCVSSRKHLEARSPGSYQ